MSPEELKQFNKWGSIATLMYKGDVKDMVWDMLDHIDSQAAQIEALKQKLVEERAQVLAGKGNLIWGLLPDDDRPDGLYPALVIRGKVYWRTVARQQLKAEMKGFGD